MRILHSGSEIPIQNQHSAFETPKFKYLNFLFASNYANTCSLDFRKQLIHGAIAAGRVCFLGVLRVVLHFPKQLFFTRAPSSWRRLPVPRPLPPPSLPSAGAQVQAHAQFRQRMPALLYILRWCALHCRAQTDLQRLLFDHQAVYRQLDLVVLPVSHTRGG